MEGLEFLQGFDKKMIGSTIYMVVARRQNNILKIFNTGIPEIPRLKEDWLALNYFCNLCDISIISVFSK